MLEKLNKIIGDFKKMDIILNIMLLVTFIGFIGLEINQQYSMNHLNFENNFIDKWSIRFSMIFITLGGIILFLTATLIKPPKESSKIKKILLIIKRIVAFLFFIVTVLLWCGIIFISILRD
jgi:hypothetical protein